VTALTRHDGRVGQARARQQFGDIERHQVEPFRVVDQVDLGEGDDSCGHGQQVEDGQMLARLRHDALVGGDHEDSQRRCRRRRPACS
jgi:hypothetical protein